MRISGNKQLIFTGLLIVPLIIFSSCKKEKAPLPEPDVYISTSATEVVEDDPSALVSLAVSLSGSFDSEITLDYGTSDSTAAAGKDYVAVSSGKLSFKPGEKTKYITVDIIGDTASKEDLYFKVVLSNPVNCKLSRSDMIVRIINVDYATLTWSDEFTDEGPLDTQNWNYEKGATGWGNNELENYTDLIDNVHQDSGYLHISALNPSGTSYTSGRITTQNKRTFTHFRVDIRAKLPEGQGIWPALWALGSNFTTEGWPKCGEIDIMELLGQAPSTCYGSLHWDSNGHVSRTGSFNLATGKFSAGFHIFSVIWTPNKLKWLVDNDEFFTLNRAVVPEFPFNLPQFFIFNVAVGGNWPGSPDGTTVFPQHMIIDYIRVYQ
jgi:hypothetical protein